MQREGQQQDGVGNERQGRRGQQTEGRQRQQKHREGRERISAHETDGEECWAGGVRVREGARDRGVCIG